MLTINLPPDQRPFSGDDVLFYYDGPLLFFLPLPEKVLLAVATDDERGPWPFFVLELTPQAKADLLANTLPLRDCYLQAKGCWFLADYGAQVLTLEPVLGIPEEELPSPGLFLQP